MLTESSEDYLRTVYELSFDGRGFVHSADVARALNVTKPSVHKAISLLEEGGYLKQEYYKPIVLTELGIEEGRRLHERYGVFHRFLTEILGVDEDIAGVEAHRIEHAVSPTTVSKWIAFMTGIDECSEAGACAAAAAIAGRVKANNAAAAAGSSEPSAAKKESAAGKAGA